MEIHSCLCPQRTGLEIHGPKLEHAEFRLDIMKKLRMAIRRARLVKHWNKLLTVLVGFVTTRGFLAYQISIYSTALNSDFASV